MRRPSKSDRPGAHSVAQLLREEADTLPRVHPEEDELASVQLWSRLESELTKDMTRLVNRLRAQARCGTASTAWATAG